MYSDALAAGRWCSCMIMPQSHRSPKRRKLSHTEEVAQPSTPISTRKSTRRAQDPVPSSQVSKSHGAQRTPKTRAAETPTRQSSRKSRSGPVTEEKSANGSAKIASSRESPLADVRKTSTGRKTRRTKPDTSTEASQQAEAEYSLEQQSVEDTPSRTRSTEQVVSGHSLDNAGKSDELAPSEHEGNANDILFTTDPILPTEDDPKVARLSATYLQDLPDSQYDLPRSITLSKLTSRRSTPLKHLDSQRSQVRQLLSSTVTSGQGNSLLLLGSRGAGKSAMVESVIDELAADPWNISTDGSPTFHVIRLDGTVQTDDKLALREIWRQLGREMNVEEDEGKVRNYADTLASLLALLSHPTELVVDVDGDVQMDEDPQAHSAGTDAKLSTAVIFLMSEFDAFAARPRQTLLYNLFDIAQSRKAPIVVLGISTRMDVAEMLEKRVKSRFSHRYIHVPAMKDFEGFMDVCRSAITVSSNELTYDEQQSLALKPLDTLDMWNASAKKFLLDGAGNALRIQLEQIYSTTRSFATAFSALYLPIATLDPACAEANVCRACFPAPIMSFSSPKLEHITSLSSLSLALLIAAARIPLLTDSNTISFPVAYDEYRALTTKARLAASSGGAQVHGGVAGRVWGKEVARGAWEDLIDAGLIIQEDSESVGGMSLCRVDVALEEIEPSAGKSMERALVKWCREL